MSVSVSISIIWHAGLFFRSYSANLKAMLSKVETIFASIPTAIGPEILKAEVNSMNSFAELSISQSRYLISASSNSTSQLDIILTHLVRLFPHYYFLDLLKLLKLSLKEACFPHFFKMAIVKSPT